MNLLDETRSSVLLVSSYPGKICLFLMFCMNMAFSNYQDTIEYLFSLLPMYQRDGQAAIKKDLTRTILLCEALDNPEKKFQSIHIAGTNGKGSVSSMLHSILVSTGFTTGLYTSPHLMDFTERIRIDTQNIDPETVIEFVNCHQALIEHITPSFFEFTVAMAFDYFATKQVDVAVVEVGLGGRLDSTNVLKPLLSIITNISFDHMEMLGNTLEEIAWEKAGIIKPQIPVVIGETQTQTEPVFTQRAIELQSPITYADTFYDVSKQEDYWNQAKYLVRDLYRQTQYTLCSDLIGNYQTHNIATVLKAVDELQAQGIDIPSKSVEDGLLKVKEISGLRGRMEVLSSSPLVIADTAHNVSGIAQIIHQIQQLTVQKLLIVWGMVKEKNHHEILELLPNNAYYIMVRPEIPRGFEEKKLLEIAQTQGKEGETAPSVIEGVQRALVLSDENDVVLIGGSTFVVAEVLPHIHSLFQFPETNNSKK